MMEMIKVIGAEDFYRYQSIFGFGAQTGIDLPGEAEGILQDPELVGPVDLATNSFGQNLQCDDGTDGCRNVSLDQWRQLL